MELIMKVYVLKNLNKTYNIKRKKSRKRIDSKYHL